MDVIVVVVMVEFSMNFTGRTYACVCDDNPSNMLPPTYSNRVRTQPCYRATLGYTISVRTY